MTEEAIQKLWYFVPVLLLFGLSAVSMHIGVQKHSAFVFVLGVFAALIGFIIGMSVAGSSV